MNSSYPNSPLPVTTQNLANIQIHQDSPTINEEPYSIHRNLEKKLAKSFTNLAIGTIFAGLTKFTSSALGIATAAMQIKSELSPRDSHIDNLAIATIAFNSIGLLSSSTSSEVETLQIKGYATQNALTLVTYLAANALNATTASLAFNGPYPLEEGTKRNVAIATLVLTVAELILNVYAGVQVCKIAHTLKKEEDKHTNTNIDAV